MEDATRVFSVEVIEPAAGISNPVLVVYVLEGDGGLTLPREVYRSSSTSKAVLRGDATLLAPEEAWAPGEYREARGYDGLEAAILDALGTPKPGRLVNQIVTNVRESIGDMPGQYA